MMAPTKPIDEEALGILSSQFDKTKMLSLNKQVEERVVKIMKLLEFGKAAEAVKEVLQHPLDRTIPAEIQNKIINSAVQALCEVNTQMIPTITKTFSPEDSNTIMKVIYRGLARPELYNSAALLTWHEQVVSIAGLGTIMAALTER